MPTTPRRATLIVLAAVTTYAALPWIVDTLAGAPVMVVLAATLLAVGFVVIGPEIPTTRGRAPTMRPRSGGRGRTRTR